MAESFQCTLVTPEEQVLEEQVLYASVPAWDGQVGIAPHRAPLLVKLGDGPLRLDFAKGGVAWYFLGGGFAQMKDNRLSLVTGEAVAAHAIVRQDAEAALREAQARRAIDDDAVQQRDRDARRARTMLHLIDVRGQRI